MFDQQEGKGESSETKETETNLEFAPYAMLAGHGGWVWDCAFTDNNNFCITVSTDHKARVWKIDREEVRRVFAGHAKGITCLAFKD
jgi:G protein beta subunit-like protein